MVDTETTPRLRKGANDLDRPPENARLARRSISSEASNASSRIGLAGHSHATAVAGVYLFGGETVM